MSGVELRMEKYTERIIHKFISKSVPPKLIGLWYEGKFHTAYADESKSRCGVKYNRLIRLSTKLRIRSKL